MTTTFYEGPDCSPTPWKTAEAAIEGNSCFKSMIRCHLLLIFLTHTFETRSLQDVAHPSTELTGILVRGTGCL